MFLTLYIFLFFLAFLLNCVCDEDVTFPLRDSVPTQDEPNWTYFEEFDGIDVNGSLSTVKALPVSHYFDVIKGGYRSAVLGMHIESILPEITFRVEKKLSVKGDKTTQSINISILDSNLALMHCFVSVQYIAGMIGSFIERIRRYLQFREEASFLLNDMLKKAGAIGSSSDLEILMSAALDELMSLNASVSYERLRNSQLAEFRKTQYDKREQHRRRRHQNLEAEIRMSFAAQTALLEIKSKNMTALVENSMNAILSIEFEAIGREYFDNIDQLKSEIELSLVGIKSRYEEEARAERLNEKLHVNVMKAKSRLSKELTLQVIHTLFQEIITRFRVILNDPYGTFVWLRTTFLVLCTFVILYELVGFIVALIVQTMTGKSRVIFTRTRSFKTVGSANDIVIPQEVIARLSIITDNLKMSLSLNKRSLPFVIINGPVGVGKSMCALSIAKASALPYSVISGADLAAHGTKVGAYLRRILDQHMSAWIFKEPKVLILDEPDNLIAKRGNSFERNPDSESHESSQSFSTADSCFYILLNALRENNPLLAVIITTSRTVAEIDYALLDRIDSIISLSLPAAEERYRLVLRYCRDILLKYVDFQELNKLDAATSVSILNSSSDTRFHSKDCSKFDLSSCVRHFVHRSQGWSCREISKVITNVQSRILASPVDGCLTSELWKAEIDHWAYERERTRLGE